MLCFSTVGEDCVLQSLRYIPRKDIECTRCHQILPITEFPPEYVLRNKKNPLCRNVKKNGKKHSVKSGGEHGRLEKIFPLRKNAEVVIKLNLFLSLTSVLITRMVSIVTVNPV